LAENKDSTRNTVSIWRKENLLDFILLELDDRVKKDRPTKLSVLFCGLSSYMQHPLNLFLRGESGSGKTYNVVETLKYFPQERIMYLGGLSKTALVHDHGVLLNKNGEPIDLDDRPEKPVRKQFQNDDDFNEALKGYKDEAKAWRQELEESYTLVDLTHTIMVFLEVPDFSTFQTLRPILSHDVTEISFKFTDKVGKRLRTMKVVVRGWPATIFLTVNMRYVEELATRSFSATPQTDELKIMLANTLTNQKNALPWQYCKETAMFLEIKGLIESLSRQIEKSDIDVLIPFLNLNDLFPHQISRDMRDFQHFCQFLKTVTFLYYYQRPQLEIEGKYYLVATVKDVDTALSVYRELFETTRTGTEKRILDFYHKIIVKQDSWLLGNATEEYNKTAKKKVSSDTVRRMLQQLDEIGYVDIRKDVDDKRKDVFAPLIKEEEKEANQRKLDNQQDVKLKLQKGFETWLENLCSKGVFYTMKNSETRPGAWGMESITSEEFSKVVMGENIFSSVNEGLLQSISNNDSTSIPQLSLEETRKQELQHNAAKLEAKNLGIPCPYCKAKGQKMFFANDVDLRAHVTAWHEGS